ncbi:MAG TPA: PAS domain S-box protein, partial [Chitinophagaceae bacterium]|nr:PAS domain S-box protein [Chitinophagaceae bacterium]
IKTKNINDELVVRKENYRVTLNSLGEGLISTNKEGRITYMNPSAEHLTGWRWQDAKGQLLQQVYNVRNEQTGKPIEHLVSRILKNGKKIEWENNTVLKTKYNDTFIISNNVSAILDINNNISGAVLLFNDITEKYKIEKQLRDSEKQYKNLIQNLPEAVFTCDASGHIQLYNKAAVELWGREPVAGKDLWCGAWKIFNTDGTDLPLDSCPMAITLKGGRPVHGKEILVQRSDKSYRHVLMYPSPLFNTEGQLTGAINMLLDVTDKKEREILIQKSEEKYHNLVEQASDAILIHSFDGTIHEFNKSCYTMLGYTAAEYANLQLSDILVEEIIVNQDNYAAILAGETKMLYRHLMRKDGSLIDAEVTVKMMADGKVIAFARDVTERKKAEEELFYSNLRLERAEEQSNIGSWQRDLASDKRYWSKNMFRLFGFEPADNPPTLEAYLESIHPDDRQNIRNRLLKISQGYEIPDYEFRTNPGWGPMRNLFATLYYEKDDAGVIFRCNGCILDITERKNAENEIREKEIFTRSILTSIRSHIAVIDENGVILEVNDAWTDFSTGNDEKILERAGKGSNYLEVCQKAADGDDIIAAKVLRGFIQVSQKEIPFFKIAYPCHSPEKEQWFQLMITKFVGESGKVVMNHTDITDLKKASKETADYKNALSQSSILAITDQNGIIKDVNENFCNISQYTAAELIGNDHRIINSGYHSKSFIKELWATIGCGKIWRGEICNKAKDGTLYWVDSTIVPFLNEKGMPFQYIAIRWDISKRKIAETRMRNAIDRYEILAHATSDTIWDWDIVNDRMIYNDGIAEMFGYNISEVKDIVDWWKDKLHSDDFKNVQDSLEDVFEKGLQRFQLTYRFRCADGSYKHIFDRAYVLFDENGKPTRMIGAMQDITYQVEEETRIAKAIIDAQEQERNYLGAELHDNINQILAGALLTLGMAKSKEVDTPKQAGFIDAAMGYIT